MGEKHDDDFSVDTPELAECARVNFQNIGNMVPAIKSHPIWTIAMAQLDALCARLED